MIVGVAGAVIFATLTLQSFDTGETITAWRVLHPSYADTMRAVASGERSGPLYYTLAWGWSHVFGIGEAGLRSMSALFGIGTIIAMFLVGRELLSRRAGVIAALLTALDPDVIWYAQEARSYPLYIFFTAAALYFFVRALKRPSTRAYVGWALAAGLALCTHYFSAFSLGVEAVWLIVAARPRVAVPLKSVAAVGVVGVALLPLAIHQEGSGRGNGFTSIPVLERGASAALKFVTGESPATSGSWSHEPLLARQVGVAALLICGAFALVLFTRGRRPERRLAAAVGSVGLLAFFLPIAMALAGADYVEPRGQLGSLAPLLAVVAGGVDVSIRLLERRRLPRIARLAPGLGLVVPLAVVVIATMTLSSFQRDNWRRLSQVALQQGPVGVVMADPGGLSRTLEYYYGKQLPSLTARNYPSGVMTSRITTISRSGPEPRARGFRLVSRVRVDQSWTVGTYVAPRPRRVSVPVLKHLDILGLGATARVDSATPAVGGGHLG